MAVLNEEDKKYLNVEAGLARVRGNAVIYKKMLGLFMKDPNFAAFDEHLAGGDLQKASEAAHGIKGMTGNLEMPAVFELSAKLMVQLREGARDEAVIADYQDALAKTRDCVERFMAD